MKFSSIRKNGHFTGYGGAVSSHLLDGVAST
jgi:hypothetical protein